MRFSRFTLRDQFWLVLVVACLCGWWVERRKLVAEVERLTLQYYLDHATSRPLAMPENPYQSPQEVGSENPVTPWRVLKEILSAFDYLDAAILAVFAAFLGVWLLGVFPGR